MNWLLIFIPIAVALEHLRPEAHTWIFFAACLAIIPIAHLIVEATEHIAVRTGDAIGGLLNATFGNAPELIISIVALKAGLFDMVRASLIGALVSGDARSNWYKGVQFITVYVIMAFLFYFMPEAAP